MSRLEKYAPPGASLRAIKVTVIIFLALIFVSDVVYFANVLVSILKQLKDPLTGELVENAKMTDFSTLWNSKGTWWSLLGLSIFLALDFYRYFYTESLSLYTMARIRSPWELHIRCWTLPLLGVGILMGSRLLLRVILFAVYVLATPAGVPKPGFEQLIGGLL